MKHLAMTSLAVLLTGSVGAFAQNAGVDVGVASEVVRNMMTPRNMLEIQQSTNLLANYREVALQQQLAQEAARRGLTERIDVQRRLELMRRTALIQALREDVERATPAPAENEIKKVYGERSADLVVPPAFQLDLWQLAAAETQTLMQAKSLASGKPVADETVAALKAPQAVSQTQDVWFGSANVASNMWSGLNEMKQNEVRLFPDGSNSLVVRRGAFRGQRKLTLEESRGQLSAELQQAAAAKAWQKLVEDTAKKLKLD